MQRCKPLRSLNSFVSCAPQLSGAHPVSLLTLRSGRWLLLAFIPLAPQPSPLGRGSIRWIAVLGALIHVWRPVIAGGCDISYLLIWQETFSFHKGKNTCPPSSIHSCSVVSDSATPRTAARQASLSISNSQSLLRLMSTESVIPSNHLMEKCLRCGHQKRI